MNGSDFVPSEPFKPSPVKMLKDVRSKDGLVFDSTGLRDAWTKATTAAEMPWLLVHDLRRSAIRNLIAVGVNERVAMSISGHKTRAVFDRYHIVSPTDVINAMSLLQKRLTKPKNSESLVRGRLTERRRKVVSS